MAESLFVEMLTSPLTGILFWTLVYSAMLLGIVVCWAAILRLAIGGER